jgi:hypothetical protein
MASLNRSVISLGVTQPLIDDSKKIVKMIATLILASTIDR